MPAFNEEASIGKTLAEVAESCPGVQVLVISDGSSDRTSEIARTSGVQVLQLPVNLGVGAALQTGFKYAHENGYQVAVQVDADGQHNPKDIPRLIEGLSEADVVIGSRFLTHTAYEVRGLRKLAMSVLAKWLSAIVKTRLTDTTSGFKAHNRKAIELFCRQYPAEYLGDTLESLVMAHRAKLSVREVPVEMRAREAGQASHGSIRSTIFLFRAGIAILFALTQSDSQRKLETVS